MRVLSIIDSFKGTLSSITLGKEMTSFLKNKKIDAFFLPISDGGEGFLDVIKFIKQTKQINCQVHDPLGRKINTYYLYDYILDTAYIEMAKSSGLNLLKKQELDPFKTSTYGFGELINDAISRKIKNIIVGIGGSATNDGGAGMLEALGIEFFNKWNQKIVSINNEKLNEVNTINCVNFLKKIKGVNFTVLSDVQNPLLGKKGATYTYGIQKGASPSSLPLLEKNIACYARAAEEEIGFTVKDHFGSGAAGGVGFAFNAFLNPQIVSGIEYLLTLLNFDNLSYDLIITGEGKVDKQSLQGKVVSGIIKRAKNKKIIIVCGQKQIKKSLLGNNIIKVYAIANEIASLDQALKNPLLTYRKLCEKVSYDLSINSLHY